jgi:hypothetical protein
MKYLKLLNWLIANIREFNQFLNFDEYYFALLLPLSSSYLIFFLIYGRN